MNPKSIKSGKIDFLPKSCYSNITVDLCSRLFSLSDTEHNKIIVITEGKSDKNILEMAYQKLYSDIDCPYIFIAAGVQINEDKKNGKRTGFFFG